MRWQHRESYKIVLRAPKAWCFRGFLIVRIVYKPEIKAVKMRSKYTGGLQVGYKWDTQYFPGRNNANPDALNDRRSCAILPIWETTEPGGLPSLSEGLPSRRKKGGRCQWLHILIWFSFILITVFICDEIYFSFIIDMIRRNKEYFED